MMKRVKPEATVKDSPLAGLPPLLTEKDLVAIGYASIHKLQRDRDRAVGLPYVKIGRLVKYRRTDVERAIQVGLRNVDESDSDDARRDSGVE